MIMSSLHGSGAWRVVGYGATAGKQATMDSPRSTSFRRPLSSLGGAWPTV